MKFTCSREQLLGGLQLVGSVVSSRGMKPVYESVLIRSRDGRLELLGTDLEVAIRYVLTDSAEGDFIRIDQAGALVVPAARLTAILREVKDEQVEFTWDKNVLSVDCDDSASHFKIMGLPEEEFPEIPDFPEPASVTLPGEVFRRMVARTGFATAKEKMRYALNGVLFLLKGTKLQMVGTDGRRLAHAAEEVENPDGADLRAIVPTKGMTQIAKVLEAGENVEIALRENQLSARTSKAVVTSRLVEGTYPNFEEVIPVNCERRARLRRESFMAAIRKAALLTVKESQSIRCRFDEDRLTLTSRAAEVGEAQVELGIEYQGEATEIAFNPVYILDGLSAMEGEAVSFEFRNPSSPAKVTDGDSYTYVVMPIDLG
jgi:DNA polymerase-3 subunit beta